MKTVGIIGGLGPGTTAEFYLQVVREYKKKTNEYPSIVIGSVSAPMKVYEDFHVADVNNFTPYLIREAKRLEGAGCDFLVMPCNSLHCDANTIRQSVSIPLLSIVDATVAQLKDDGHKKVGLLSLIAVINRQVYQNTLSKNNIDHITAEAASQDELNKIVTRLCDDIYLDEDKELIMSVISDMKKGGCDAILLACTDLQLAIKQDKIYDMPIIDTMKVLAKATVTALLE